MDTGSVKVKFNSLEPGLNTIFYRVLYIINRDLIYAPGNK